MLQIWTSRSSRKMPRVWVSSSCWFVYISYNRGLRLCLQFFVGVVGIALNPETPESWTCDVCQNEKSQDGSLVGVHHFSLLIVLIPCIFRTTIADYVRVPNVRRSQDSIHLPIPTYVPASQRKDTAGPTSFALFSSLRSNFRTRRNYKTWKQSALFRDNDGFP